MTLNRYRGLQETGMTRHLQPIALTIAILLFVLVGAFALSSCQTYQPPGEDIWRAL
jgi:predicted small secreted protein